MAIPGSRDGQLRAAADKLYTLAGVFSLGKKPGGNRDPFGLRRAALGIVRILIEGGLDIDLKALISVAVDAQPKGKLDSDEVAADVYGFITDRLRRYFLDPALKPRHLMPSWFDSRHRCWTSIDGLPPYKLLHDSNKPRALPLQINASPTYCARPAIRPA